jgi:succinate dehydrogenase / fumarate reductase flavoprotein subunit
VGECAAASFHGFNRLGTNSILELITMGRFVGVRILSYISDAGKKLPDVKGSRTESKFSAYLDADGVDNLGNIRETLRSAMTDKVGVFRTETGISQAIETIKELKDRADSTALSEKSLTMNQELITRWELDNLLTVSMSIAQAALNRKESRGAHCREDFPERLTEYNDHTLVSMPEFGTMHFGNRPVDMSVFEAREDHYEQFGMIERKY